MGARGCILSIYGVKTHPGPDEKALEMNRKAVCVVLGPFLCENQSLRKRHFFGCHFGSFCGQNGPKEVQFNAKNAFLGGFDA